MDKDRVGNVGHMNHVYQWLKSNPSTWEDLHLSPDQEDSGLATKLYATCLDMLQSLCQQPLDQNSLQKQPHVLREELGKLFLWGDNFKTGELDKALAFADGLQDIVLRKLKEIGLLLLEFKSSPDFIKAGSLKSYEGLKTLVQQARSNVVRRTIKDDAESDDSCSDSDYDEESRSTAYEVWQITRRLQTQISQLVRIGPTIRRYLARLETDELKSKSMYPPIVPFQVSNAAGFYVSLVRDKFKDASNDLVERLGEANWQRHQNVRDVSAAIDGSTLHQPKAPELASTAIFRPVSTFHDSGLGTSVPYESNYAPSHTSFLSSNTNGELGDLRVPATPAEVQQGKPFECFLCKKMLTNIKNRVDWKVHVYADLRPYICTFPGCKVELAQYSSRIEWGEHEFKHHRVTYTWKCPDCPVICAKLTDYESHTKSSHGRQQASVAWQTYLDLASEKQENPAEHEKCPLCCSMPGGSRRIFINHVARHMEQIALLALPRDTEESDDEAEKNDSESFTDGTCTSDRQNAALKSKPVEDLDHSASSTNKKANKHSRSPSPSHTELHASIIGNFEAQYRASATWSPEQDKLLIQARRQGFRWQLIADIHFPHKSANACRKRHERLMGKQIEGKQENQFSGHSMTHKSRGFSPHVDIISPRLEDEGWKTADANRKYSLVDIQRTEIETYKYMSERKPLPTAVGFSAATFTANSQDPSATKDVYSCNFCGIWHPGPEAFEAHQETHKSESLRAREAPTASPMKHAEKSRRGTTSEENTHECEVCGKSFKRSYNWESHMKTHDPDRKYPHPCTAMVGNQPCPKKFQRKTDLQRHHDSVHKKTRKYQCDLCGNRFVRPDTLRRHTEDGCPKRFEFGFNDRTRIPSDQFFAGSLGQHRSDRLDLPPPPSPAKKSLKMPNDVLNAQVSILNQTLPLASPSPGSSTHSAKPELPLTSKPIEPYGPVEGPRSLPPPLPEAWLAQWESRSGKYCYVHRATGHSQWETPIVPTLPDSYDSSLVTE